MTSEDQLHLDSIKSLKDGMVFTYPRGDYGLAEIWFKNESYFLFEIPLYGGSPNFVKAYRKNNLQDLILEIHSMS